MSERERLSACAESRQAAQAWRTVEPEEGGRYIGSYAVLDQLVLD